MSKDIEEDKIGEKGEVLICWLANNHVDFQNFLKTCMKTIRVVDGSSSIERVYCNRARGTKKTDLVLKLVTDRDEVKVGATVKTRRECGRPDSHLDRRWLRDWQAVLKMPSDIYECFQEGLMGLAKKTTQSLISPRMRDKVRGFLTQHARDILEETIRGGERSLRLFSVVEYTRTFAAIYFFNVDDVVTVLEENIKSKGVKFNSVIYLGDFMWIQRKGGDGKRVSIPKTHPDHPGNQLQVKIKIIDLVQHVVSSGKTPYCGPYRINVDLVV